MNNVSRICPCREVQYFHVNALTWKACECMKNLMAGKGLKSVTMMLSDHGQNPVDSPAIEDLTDCNETTAEKLKGYEMRNRPGHRLQQEPRTQRDLMGQKINLTTRFRTVADAGSVRQDEGLSEVTYMMPGGTGTGHLGTKAKPGTKVV